MKVHYFDQSKPDADDVFLAVEIRAGTVPETCLLGGIVVGSLKVARPDKKPCASCDGPRDRCKGAPREPDAEKSPFETAILEAIGDGDELRALVDFQKKLREQKS